MSVRERVLEAEVLWKSNKKEGAWIQAMIAVAATARKRYPKPIPDSQAFMQYVKDITWTIISGRPKPPNFQNGQVLFVFDGRPFAEILYKDFRCSWVHEAQLEGVGLSETKIDGEKVIQTLVVGQYTQLPADWVLNILKAIRWSPENGDEFPG